MQRIKILISTIVLSLGLILVPAIAHAQKSELECGVNHAAGGNDCNAPAQQGKTLNETITAVVNILSSLAGVAAVIMIIYGGFRYITSGGDSNRVTSAKNTIIYALIGLLIVALSQVIVRFVLGKTT